MNPALEHDIAEFLLRCIREHEEEWLAIEAESLLKRMNARPITASEILYWREHLPEPPPQPPPQWLEDLVRLIRDMIK